MIAHYSSFNSQDNYARGVEKADLREAWHFGNCLAVAPICVTHGTGTFFADNSHIGPFIGIGRSNTLVYRRAFDGTATIGIVPVASALPKTESGYY